MASEVAVSDDIKEFITSLIEKYDLDPNAEVIYGAGSEIGDGYLSKTLTVNVEDKRDPLQLFLKYALVMKGTSIIPLEKIYQNESYFYDVVYPAYQKFIQNRGFEDSLLKSIPKCYGTSPKNIIALENLRLRGFEMFDRKKTMNENHILAVLKSLAEYHAASLAFKDQEGEEYRKIMDGILNLFDKEIDGMEDMQKQVLGAFFNKLDPVEDKEMLRRTENLAEKILNYVRSTMVVKENEYTVITKGDCWSNNMMFHYEDDDVKDTPSEVMLVDWQIIKPASLVMDLSYAFYTLATGNELDKLDFYLKYYHGELSKILRDLGSEPDVVYPYAVLKQEWKDNCIFGYAMAFSIIKFMLLNKEEAPNLEEVDVVSDTFMKVGADNNEYFRRMKKLTQHMIDNNFI